MPRQVLYLPPPSDQIRRLAFKTCHRMKLEEVHDKQAFAGFLKALMAAYASRLTLERNQGEASCPSHA